MVPTKIPKASRYGACAGLGLAGAALLLLAASPLGWRFGWWHYGFSLLRLMPLSAYFAAAALATSILALIAGGLALDARSAGIAGVALVVSAGLVYVPWQYRHELNSVPRIHDITTDTANPPTFVAALPARAAEKANTVVYGGPELARQQKAAFPDIVPLRVALPPREAFQLALDTARAMPRWTVIYSDPVSGRIEANEASFWFRFVDDVAIRVAADGTGSRIDVRSESRHGGADFGVNARRVRAYLGALKARVGERPG